MFGNSDLKEDSLAKIVANEIMQENKSENKNKYDFVFCDKPDDVLSYLDSDFCILDVVKNLHDVKLFLDVDNFKSVCTVTAHDFDLSTFLKILKETGDLLSVKIIGIPQDGDVLEIKRKVMSLLNAV